MLLLSENEFLFFVGLNFFLLDFVFKEIILELLCNFVF